jgi:hypothetical protein
MISFVNKATISTPEMKDYIAGPFKEDAYLMSCCLRLGLLLHGLLWQSLLEAVLAKT